MRLLKAQLKGKSTKTSSTEHVIHQK